MKQRWSDADFAYFKERVMYWRRRLGLMDYDIVVKIDQPKESGVGAAARACHENKLAEIILCPTIDPDASRPNNRVTLDQWALHEVLHVLMTEYRWYTVHTEPKKVDAAEHGIIRALENLILGDDR